MTELENLRRAQRLLPCLERGLMQPTKGPAPAVARNPAWCPVCGADLDDDDARFCPMDGSRLRRPDQERRSRVEAVIAGDIVLGERIGSGGCGDVYRGWQRSLGRDVAVKILRGEHAGKRELVQRFEREARIGGQLRHPHLVEFHLAGGLADGSPFIVMEYVRGISLASALAAQGGTFAIERAVAVVLQISDGVAFLHERGVTHRDLKPDNVLLARTADGTDRVKVLDYGIAKGAIGDDWPGTAAGLVVGTPRYMSPEAAHGAGVGPASDVYALATILYEMLAGRTPFEDDEGLALLVKQVHGVPPPLRAPDAIAAVVMESLAKDPASRAPNARAFGAALARAALADGLGPVVSVPPAAPCPRGWRRVAAGALALLLGASSTVGAAAASHRAERCPAGVCALAPPAGRLLAHEGREQLGHDRKPVKRMTTRDKV
jgi:serine/threonine-protein kinase